MGPVIQVFILLMMTFTTVAIISFRAKYSYVEINYYKSLQLISSVHPSELYIPDQLSLLFW